MKQQLPVRKKDKVTVTFTDMTHNGAGVAKIDGYTLFVDGGLPGEEAIVQVQKTKKQYGYARLLEVTSESRDRVNPACPIFLQCGGCQLQHLSYAGQLRQKQQRVEDALQKIGGFTSVAVQDILGMAEPWAYRNKAQVPVGTRKDGLVIGFYQKGSHDIVPMDACLIQDSVNDHALQQVKAIVDACGVRAYDEAKHRGELRHIVVRSGQQSGELMVILVTRTKHLPGRKQIVRDITSQIPQVYAIVQNINPHKTNTIFGDETRVLWGRDVIYDSIGSIRFAISARSFYQVNPSQTRVLYETALRFAELEGSETVVDAYCGIGTISLFLAQKAGHVYGVESVEEAVEDAKQNAALNKLENVTFQAGRAEDVIPRWMKDGVRGDVMVVDPPRKGCDQTLLDTMLHMEPRRIVYVSCNPATLARDLRVLTDGGYQLQDVQPVDMFPQTMHVECVVKLTKP